MRRWRRRCVRLLSPTCRSSWTRTVIAGSCIQRRQTLTGSTDAGIRAGVNHIDVIDYGPTSAVVAPPLEHARVAIVTTAGLRTDGQATWTEGQGFTVLDHADRTVSQTHVSVNFDRAGLAADLNVVYPVDRLDELAAAGRIGSVAPRHLSFMGAQLDHTFTTLLLDTGPAAAKILIDDGVDVVLLTPV